MWGRNSLQNKRMSADPPPAGESSGRPTPLPGLKIDQKAQDSVLVPPPASETPASARGAWRMGLVVTASAFCGGIAVVLWNRRLLTKMREVAPIAHPDQQRHLWEDDL